MPADAVRRSRAGLSDPNRPVGSFLFLWNFRTSAITLTAIPLSFVITGLLFHLLGFTINTITTDKL